MQEQIPRCARDDSGQNRGLVRSGMSILSGCVLVLHNYDVLGGMLNPFSELVDVSVGVHGFDHEEAVT